MDVPTLLGGGPLITELRPDIVVVVEAANHGALNLLEERATLGRAERREAFAFLFAGVVPARRVVELLYAIAQQRCGLLVLGCLRIEALDHLGVGSIVNRIVRIEIAGHADEGRALF